MSVSNSVEKLSSPIKDLVASTLKSDSLVGKFEKDQAEVAAWIDKVAAGDVVKDLKTLDTELTPKTYLVSTYPTAADVSLYGALHPVLSQLQPAQYYTHPALTRYFDHIQSLPFVREAVSSLAQSAFSPITFDLENAPKLERKADPPKQKKPKADAAAPAEQKAEASGAPKEQGKEKGQKKEKKEKKKDSAAATEGAAEGKKKGGQQPKAQPVDDGPPVPSMIDLRVGRIVDVKKHPDADSLYVEQIDIGEETGPRTVVSGLVKYVPIEEMQGKLLIAVCNLKPATMRGVKSFAMVLCATSPDGKDAGVEIVNPPPNAQPGDRVYFEGEYENGTPLAQLNPKKKIFETIQPGFTTLDTREAAWVNPETKSVHKIRTKDGVCLAPTFVGASLS